MPSGTSLDRWKGTIGDAHHHTYAGPGSSVPARRPMRSQPARQVNAPGTASQCHGTLGALLMSMQGKRERSKSAPSYLCGPRQISARMPPCECATSETGPCARNSLSISLYTRHRYQANERPVNPLGTHSSVLTCTVATAALLIRLLRMM